MKINRKPIRSTTGVYIMTGVLLAAILTLAILTGCDKDLPRSNPLDPQNPANQEQKK